MILHKAYHRFLCKMYSKWFTVNMHKKLYTYLCNVLKSTNYKKKFEKSVDKCRPLWYNVIVLEREYKVKNYIYERRDLL